MAEDVGALLLRAGLIAERDLDRAREEKARRGGTTAERLVECGAIGDETLTQFLATQLMLPRVEADALADIPAGVRNRLPADLATELRAVPVAFDRDSNLTVVLSDPSDEHTVEQIRFFTGTYVVRAVCTQVQLAWCLAHYYGHLTDLGRSLALAAANPAAEEAKIAWGGGGPGFGDEETGVTGPIARVRLPAPTPEELAPRSGEFTAAGDVDRTAPKLPAVVVDDDPDPFLGDGPAPAEIAPAPLQAGGVGVVQDAVPVEGSHAVVLLSSVKPARRQRRPTEVGVGRAGTGDPARPARQTDVEAMMASQQRDEGKGKSKSKAAAAAKKPAVDDGWDVDDWAAPGNTIPPAYLGAGAVQGASLAPDVSPATAAAPTEAATAAGEVAPVPAIEAVPAAAAGPVDPVPPPNAEAVAASADRLLAVLRAVEDAQSRDAIVDAALAFVRVAAPRAGFAARKGDALSSYRGKGAPLGAEVAFDAGPMMTTLLQAGPFRGPVDGAEASFVSSLLGADPMSVSAVPVVVRGKLVGAFFAEATPALVDEHVAVIARAAGIALERVLLNQKR